MSAVEGSLDGDRSLHLLWLDSLAGLLLTLQPLWDSLTIHVVLQRVIVRMKTVKTSKASTTGPSEVGQLEPPIHPKLAVSQHPEPTDLSPTFYPTYIPPLLFTPPYEH
jgi:hypothetical protein